MLWIIVENKRKKHIQIKIKITHFEIYNCMLPYFDLFHSSFDAYFLIIFCYKPSTPGWFTLLTIQSCNFAI